MFINLLDLHISRATDCFLWGLPGVLVRDPKQVHAAEKPLVSSGWSLLSSLLRDTSWQSLVRNDKLN